MSEAEEVRGVASRERLTAQRRERVARRLLWAWGRDPHLASQLADALDVTAHWLRALRRRVERGEEPSHQRGRPPHAQEERARVRALLEQGRAERGGLPLVWQTDGGGANRSDVVKRYLAAERVIHLLSRPHAPTDNAAAEAKNRKLKEEARLASGACVRDAFYEDARSAMEAAVLGLTDVKQIRKAQQDAIWRTLEKHHLARRHVGPRRLPSRQATAVAAQAAELECARGQPA